MVIWIAECKYLFNFHKFAMEFPSEAIIYYASLFKWLSMDICSWDYAHSKSVIKCVKVAPGIFQIDGEQHFKGRV